MFYFSLSLVTMPINSSYVRNLPNVNLFWFFLILREGIREYVPTKASLLIIKTQLTYFLVSTNTKSNQCAQTLNSIFITVKIFILSGKVFQGAIDIIFNQLKSRSHKGKQILFLNSLYLEYKNMDYQVTIRLVVQVLKKRLYNLKNWSTIHQNIRFLGK